LKTDTDISIRIATADDAGAIHALILELAEQLDVREKIASSNKDIRDALLGTEPAVHALLAEQGDIAIGVAIFFLSFSTWRGSNGVYLQDIYLRSGEREEGTGKRLLAKVAEWATAQGADHMRLSVDVENVAAQSFYRHIGMSNRDDEMIFQISGRDFQVLGEKG
jgi:GNAT superfamily N-acetyltransferase